MCVRVRGGVSPAMLGAASRGQKHGAPQRQHLAGDSSVRHPLCCQRSCSICARLCRIRAAFLHVLVRSPLIHRTWYIPPCLCVFISEQHRPLKVCQGLERRGPSSSLAEGLFMCSVVKLCFHFTAFTNRKCRNEQKLGGLVRLLPQCISHMYGVQTWTRQQDRCME